MKKIPDVSEMNNSVFCVFFENIFNELERYGAFDAFSCLYQHRFNEKCQVKALGMLFDVAEDSYYDNQENSKIRIFYNVVFAIFLYHEESICLRLHRDLSVMAQKKSSLKKTNEFGELDNSKWSKFLDKYCAEIIEPAFSVFYDKNINFLIEISGKADLDLLIENRAGRTIIYTHPEEYFFGSKIGVLKDRVVLMCSVSYLEALVEEKEYQEQQEDALMMKNNEGYVSLENTDGEDCLAEEMSGYEYEAYLIKRINNETIFHASGTPGSGDQGGDIIIKGRGFNAVAQVKRYSGTVGNKAIQEAFSAKSFYNAGIALVITNSDYTPSAYALAEKTGVIALTEKKAMRLFKAFE